MLKNIAKTQVITDKNDNFNVKSADRLLTTKKAGKKQAGVRIVSSKKTADRRAYVSPKNGKKLDITDFLLKKNPSEYAKSTLKSLILLKNPLNWRGNVVIPPGSFIENVVAVFRNETDIPLEMACFVAINNIAAKLLDLGSYVDFSGQIIKSDIWTILLAKSGDGKTYTNNVFEKSIKLNNVFDSGIQSAAKFIESLRDNNNSIWVRDEFAQLLKAMKTQSYLEELKEYLLKIYDNKTVMRITKDYEIIVENPAMVIMGLNAYDTFLGNVSSEDVLDGFAARFNYVIAKPDEDRPALSVPLYKTGILINAIKKSWKKIKFPTKNKKYIFGKNAEKAFNKAFIEYAGTEAENIPAAFLRRTLFKSIKYAFIYHILLGKSKLNEIDAEDIGWSMRLVFLHIADTKELLQDYGFSNLENTVKKIEKLKNKYKESGKNLQVRDIISHIREVKSVNEARSILEIIN